jgi:hypothetical protein
MNCDSMPRDLRSFIDEELLESRKREVAGHLGGCASCRGKIDSMKALSLALRSLPPEPLARDFSGRLEEKLDRIDRARDWKSWLPWKAKSSVELRLAWAFCLLLLVIGCGRQAINSSRVILNKLLELNRSGRREQAYQEALKALKSGDLPVEQRCQALEGAEPRDSARSSRSARPNGSSTWLFGNPAPAVGPRQASWPKPSSKTTALRSGIGAKHWLSMGRANSIYRNPTASAKPFKFTSASAPKREFSLLTSGLTARCGI